VFPTGHALFGDDLYIYYGAADMHIAVANLLNYDELKKQHKYNSTMRLEKGLKMLIISSYPPRECGLATFK
jgi:hypothetical protein